MSAIDAGVVFLPRLTTLVGATAFTTAPLDVSRQGGAQFQVWRGPIRVTTGTPTLTLFLEESLDGQTWSLGPSTPQAITIQESVAQFFAYSFRLRWFRLKFVLTGTNPMVSCWAQGLLRGGDGGLWGPTIAAASEPAGVLAGRMVPGTMAGAMAGAPPADLGKLTDTYKPLSSWTGEDQRNWVKHLVEQAERAAKWLQENRADI